MNEALLLQLINELEAKVKLGSRENWTNNEYQKIANLIFEESNIKISSSTIRRLFKERNKLVNLPQRETLNALAITVGYTNWAAYTNDKSKLKDTNKKYILPVQIRYIVFVFIFIGAVLSLVVFKKSNIDYSNIVFEGSHLVGNKVPHTVFVKYNLGESNQVFYIDWDDHLPDGSEPDLPVLLDNNEGIITHTYYNKRKYKITLLDKKGNLIKELNPQINTKGWECFVLSNNDLFKIDSVNFQFDDKLDASAYINNNAERFDNYDLRLFYRNIGDFNVKDNFVFSFEVEPKFNEDKVECHHLQVEIFGANNYFLFTLMQEGCENFSSLNIGNKIIRGEENDLSKLSIPNNKKTSIQIEVRNSKLFLFNNSKIYTAEMEKEFGSVLGIRFEFKGAGIIHHSELN